jgi:predicted RNA-binding Zn ribbon-like protein
MRVEADHPTKAKKVWAAAMDLRRALDAIFRTLAKGKPPPEHAVRVLNATLAEAHARRRLQPQGGGAMAWRWEAEALDIVAWEIALAAAALLTDAERCARIRICGNPACDWMFLDDSRTGKRRWCRMNVCGNEAKVRRFRERQRDGQ